MDIYVRTVDSDDHALSLPSLNFSAAPAYFSFALVGHFRKLIDRLISRSSGTFSTTVRDNGLGTCMSTGREVSSEHASCSLYTQPMLHHDISTMLTNDHDTQVVKYNRDSTPPQTRFSILSPIQAIDFHSSRYIFASTCRPTGAACGGNVEGIGLQVDG